MTNIIDWAKQNKLAAGGIGAVGLFYLMHKGNAANSADVSSSDGTAAGAPADGQHVQLIPVSSDNAGTDATGDPSLGGGIDQMPTVSGNDPTSNQDTLNQQFDNFMQLLQLQQQIAADNAAAGTSDTTDQPVSNDTPIVPSGPGASGNIAAAAATAAATHPAGHPGYTTVIKPSASHGGQPYVYHQEVRPGGHVVDIPVRPATHPQPSHPKSNRVTTRRPSHPAAKPSASHHVTKPKPKPKATHHRH